MAEENELQATQIANATQNPHAVQGPPRPQKPECIRNQIEWAK